MDQAGLTKLLVGRFDGLARQKASKLSRTDVWRFNFGLPPKRYLELFGPKPPRPVKGWMGPVCIINPERETIDLIWPDIERTYENERAVFAKRVAKEA